MKTNLTPLNTITELKSVLLIDSLEIDNFVNHKLLEIYGISDVISFRSANKALSYLKETNISYQLILIDIYLPIMGGFEFIDVIRSLKLHKKHGEICLLSASINPLDKEKAKQKNIRFIDKPLKINNLLQKI
jgi:CheY-like chemotaxis protein